PGGQPGFGHWWRYVEHSPGTLTYHADSGREYELTFPPWIDDQTPDPIPLELAMNGGSSTPDGYTQIDFYFRVGLIQGAVEARGDMFVPPDSNSFNGPASLPGPGASSSATDQKS